MPIFYIADDVYSFRHNARVVKAFTPSGAAEAYCAELFDSGDFDADRPIECIVAEDESGKNATRFKVTRTITIDDDAREVGPVTIPSDESEDD